MSRTQVHRHRWDHLPHATAVQRANRWLAIKVTTGVGTMWCAYAFAVIALIGLPSAVQQSTAGGFHPLPLVQWVAQTFLQLVLLSVILVGQVVLGEASDARAAKTFEDAEQAKAALAVALDLLDCRTEGGLSEVLAAVGEARKDFARTVAAMNERLAP